MLWSMGKGLERPPLAREEGVLRKHAVPGRPHRHHLRIPRDARVPQWAQDHYGFDLAVWTNWEARGRGIGYETTDPVTVTHELKTVALQQCLSANGFDALITGIRRDEDSTRAKERYFSPRNAEFEWDYKDQPPEFWNHFTTESGPGEHVRVQPLLDWTEIDIWRYLDREKVPLPGMYFSRNGQRYRSLGCMPITKPSAATRRRSPTSSRS